jgi:hypothetical protein
MIISAGLLAGHAAERILWDPDSAVDFARIGTNDVVAEIVSTDAGKVLRVVTGQREHWPGVTLKAGSGCWDLSAYGSVTGDVWNRGSNALTLHCRVDNPGGNGVKACITGSTRVEPGKRRTILVPLKQAVDDKLGGKLYGMRGYPVAYEAPGSLNTSNITQVLFFVDNEAGATFELSRVRAVGTYLPPTAWTSDAQPFFPFIDSLGQYLHKSWPGKSRDIAALQANREAEAQELEAAKAPADWNRFGGWATGPKLKAMGFFRTEKYNGKWWLVDPDGALFFSQGIDCVGMLDTTPVEEREDWFQNFPPPDPELAKFFSSGFVLKGHFADRRVRCFSVAGANLRRKYGAGWKTILPGVIHRRLRSWGINTIANWSDSRVFLFRQTPYTDAISSGRTKIIEGSEGYWGKFPDVFDPSFATAVKAAMETKTGRSAGDPWCIGFFSDNEMSWGDEYSLGLAALRSGAEQAIKKAFIESLKAKYVAPERLNLAWGKSYTNWQELAENREAPDTTKAGADLTAFYSQAADRYFCTIREAIKAVAPNQLYLGCRFAWVNHPAFVGCHWFQYQDEPTTGRVYDEENYQIGFVDIADTPYPEMLSASRKIADSLYATRHSR